jgi:hypothetical protein
MPSRITDVEIKPKLHVLRGLEITRDDFYQALELALDDLDGVPRDKLPAPSRIPLLVRGHQLPLGEIARIEVSLFQAP